jgi:hypothetical protein
MSFGNYPLDTSNMMCLLDMSCVPDAVMGLSLFYIASSRYCTLLKIFLLTILYKGYLPREMCKAPYSPQEIHRHSYPARKKRHSTSSDMGKSISMAPCKKVRVVLARGRLHPTSTSLTFFYLLVIQYTSSMVVLNSDIGRFFLSVFNITGNLFLI